MTKSQARRIAAATLIAIIGFSSMSALGFWQYSRAHRDDIATRILAEPPVPVASLTRTATYVPETGFAHSVTVQGTMMDSKALATCGRLQSDGRSGCWIIAPVGDERSAIKIGRAHV